VAVLTDEVLCDLLEGHDVCLGTGLLHRVPDHWREHGFLTSTHDLPDLECTTSHLLEVVGKSLSILLVNGVFC
jgi:hypothetical protein